MLESDYFLNPIKKYQCHGAHAYMLFMSHAHACVYFHLSNRAACPKNFVRISRSYKSLASIISMTYLVPHYFWETQVNNLKLEWSHLDWRKWMHVKMHSLRASRRLGNFLGSVLKWFWQFPEQYSHYWTREWIETLPYFSLLKCLYCSFNGLWVFLSPSLLSPLQSVHQWRGRTYLRWGPC